MTTPATGSDNGRLHCRTSSLDRFDWYVKLVEGWGKLRRYRLTKLRPRYVKRMLKARRGECLRCGKCCAIMFRCPDLKDKNKCSIYEDRYEQCGHFPIDQRDLRFHEDTCGHWFVREEESSSGE